MLQELKGHNDSVEIAKFSFDGKYLLTGGMSVYLQVWTLLAKNSQQEETKSAPLY